MTSTRIRIRFKEAVTYIVELDVPEELVREAAADDDAEELEDFLCDVDDSSDSAEPRWFDLLASQAPGWSHNRMAGVDARVLQSLEVIPPGEHLVHSPKPDVHITFTFIDGSTAELDVPADHPLAEFTNWSAFKG